MQECSTKLTFIELLLNNKFLKLYELSKGTNEARAANIKYCCFLHVF